MKFSLREMDHGYSRKVIIQLSGTENPCGYGEGRFEEGNNVQECGSIPIHGQHSCRVRLVQVLLEQPASI